MDTIYIDYVLVPHILNQYMIIISNFYACRARAEVECNDCFSNMIAIEGTHNCNMSLRNDWYRPLAGI